jgi:hypothetical protein
MEVRENLERTEWRHERVWVHVISEHQRHTSFLFKKLKIKIYDTPFLAIRIF